MLKHSALEMGESFVGLYRASERVLSIEAMQDMLADANQELGALEADFEAVRRHYREEWH